MHELISSIDAAIEDAAQGAAQQAKCALGLAIYLLSGNAPVFS
jgi:hypothetical protein